MIDKQTNTRLKRFAQDARRYLIDQVNTKLSEVLAPDSDAATYDKTKPLYTGLLKEIEKVTGGRYHVSGGLSPDTCDLKPLAERVAYTWFNRLTALRYMDIKHFNPVGIISPQSGDTLPQILAEAKLGVIDSSLIDPSDRDRVLGLLSGTIASTYHKGDAQSEAYRVLLLSACNQIGKSLPFLFKPIKDWMELLLPDDLLGEHGILAMIREVMTKESCQDVEVIGWLYQYYISEKKDEVFANVKKGKKVQSAEIPAVTQLFTPHWIVKYMVQNSLGRLWLDNHPNSSLNAKMEFYVAQEADPAEPVILQDRHPALQVKSPEDIKFCDPCCGSGHILTYAFDLLYDIYSEEGYDPIDIPRLIISKNLYGIEIDERAAELAAFVLSMKARDKDRQWFSRGIDPNICRLENISFDGDEIEPYMDKFGRDVFTLNFERMLSQFEHADTFGSLIVPAEQDIDAISETLNAKDFSGDVFLAPTHKKVLTLLKQADYLSTKYQVVVTNPPYMGKGMSDQLSKYLQDFYQDVKSDLFSAFVKRCSGLGIEAAFIGIMSPNVWMYIASYEKLRKWMTTERTLTSLVELPLSGFTGATVQICAYNFMNLINSSLKGSFVRLIGFKGADVEMSDYTQKAVANPDCGYFYRISSSEFKKIPGAPIAYWVSDKVRDIFSNSKPLAELASPKQGLATADNDRFLRQWFEASHDRIGFGMKNREEARQSGKKWFPYNKGGEFRKWYGNQEFVVNWENDGEEIRNFIDDKGKLRSRPQNTDFYFRESVGWTLLSSSYFGVRYNPYGSIFDVNGMSCFTDTPLTVLGLMISNMCTEFLRVINPTLAFQVGDIQKIPFLDSLSSLPTNQIADTIRLGVKDWDSFETSWDFQQSPMLDVRGEGLGLRECYAKLREQWTEMTLDMQELEEENNRIFIEAYGLQDELTPEVPLKEITLSCNPYYRYGVDAEGLGVSELGVREQDGSNSKALIKPSSTLNQALTINAKLRLDEHLTEAMKQGGREFTIRKDLEDRLLADTIKELISYAVGCMFGRYSLEKPGLILANQDDSFEDYLNLIPNPSFLPDKDNVIPILDGEWFIDDIANRFTEFLKVAFGAEKYSENISFIEEAIGKPLRTYFLKDFYNDHVKRYKKRPIYWLFSSPNGSFSALIYMHRYTPDTASIILNGYLREYIHKLRAKVSQLEHQLNAGDQNERDKMLTRKDIERLKEVISELELWDAKVLLPLAEKRIEIDLDDGVKVNYGKFGDAVKRF